MAMTMVIAFHRLDTNLGVLHPHGNPLWIGTLFVLIFQMKLGPREVK